MGLSPVLLLFLREQSAKVLYSCITHDLAILCYVGLVPLLRIQSDRLQSALDPPHLSNSEIGQGLARASPFTRSCVWLGNPRSFIFLPQVEGPGPRFLLLLIRFLLRVRGAVNSVIGALGGDVSEFPADPPQHYHLLYALLLSRRYILLIERKAPRIQIEIIQSVRMNLGCSCRRIRPVDCH